MGIPIASPKVEVPCSIFVDVPNVYNYFDTLHPRPRWDALEREIDRQLELAPELYLKNVVAYTHDKSQGAAVAGHLTQLRRELYRTGFEVVTRVGHDIDSLIINDIWMTTVSAYQGLFAKHEAVTLPVKIHHILVSGDRGYLRAYESIKAAFGPGEIDITFDVISWRGHLSADLARHAESVTYLDDVPGFGFKQRDTPAA